MSISSAPISALMTATLVMSTLAADFDNDGVDDALDLCDNTPVGTAVDAQGRPLGDLDGDCDTDIDDFALFQTGVTGPLELVGKQAGPGDLVIVEIMRNPAAVSDSLGEYFEVINAAAVPIILNGLFVEDLGTDSFMIPMSPVLLLVPGERFVFGQEDDIALNGGIEIDLEFQDAAWFLGNGSDEIVIRNDGELIDQVVYDDVSWPFVSGRAMNFDAALPPDNATNDDADNWCNASTPIGNGDFGTPGEADDTCRAGPMPGDLVIVEVMYNPDGIPDDDGEYIEILNVTDRTLDVAGLQVLDNTNNPATLGGAEFLLQPGERLLFAANGDFNENGNLVEDAVFDFRLGNTQDTIEVRFNGMLIDSFSYTSGGAFPTGVAGRSLQFARFVPATATANDLPTNWCLTEDPDDVYFVAPGTLDSNFGTPGTDNNLCF